MAGKGKSRSSSYAKPANVKSDGSRPDGIVENQSDTDDGSDTDIEPSKSESKLGDGAMANADRDTPGYSATVEAFQGNLPQSYKYEVASFKGSADSYVAVVRASITTIKEADEWVHAFERATKTNWNVRASYPHQKLLRKDYVCHLHNFRNRPLKGKKNESRIKFNGCPAELVIKIKPVTKATLHRYKWVRDGMRAAIIINFTHNHSVMDAHSLSFRRLDPAIRSMFAGYFNLGMSASTAAKYHRQRLETDLDIGDPSIVLDDAARNPKRRTISYLYTLWRESKLNEPSDVVDEDIEPVPVAKLYKENPALSTNISASETPIPADTSTSTTANIVGTTPVVMATTTVTTPAVSSATTLMAWRALSKKVERCLRRLAPHDPDLLVGLAQMDERLSKLTTHTQLVTFFRSADIQPPQSSVPPKPETPALNATPTVPNSVVLVPDSNVQPLSALPPRRKQPRPKRAAKRQTLSSMPLVPTLPMQVTAEAAQVSEAVPVSTAVTIPGQFVSMSDVVSIEPVHLHLKQSFCSLPTASANCTVASAVQPTAIAVDVPCYGTSEFIPNYAHYFSASTGWDYL